MQFTIMGRELLPARLHAPMLNARSEGPVTIADRERH